jgi:two-component system, OmpR family, sensor kinase
MLLVLALAGLFVYLQVESDLSDSLDESLETRAGDARDRPRSRIAGEEEFVDKVVAPRDEIETVVNAFTPVLGREQAERALVDPVFVSRDGPRGGDFRYLALPVRDGSEVGLVVAGASTEDRDETLAGLRAAFGVGAPVAILLASGLGFLLSGRALAPVAAMRRRASEITLERSGERLPLPPADDEIRALAATLNEMLDRIESSLERERVFVADAGHELRTPLAILRTELELAGRHERDPGELRAAIASAAEEVERLTRLAEDLLVIARSDQGRLPIKRESVDQAALVERVRGSLERRAEKAGREITAEAPAGAATEVDPLRMEQALGNLAENALGHGTGPIRLRAGLTDETAWFEVSDDGPGFPAEFAEHAFERFSRADEGRTGGGAGLGLAIVRAIAVAHGGEAELTRNGDPHTTVRISVPHRRGG